MTASYIKYEKDQVLCICLVSHLCAVFQSVRLSQMYQRPLLYSHHVKKQQYFEQNKDF